MRKIWTFIKKVLKRLLPPTVHVFMREVIGLHGAMAAREANLSHQLGVAKMETQSLMKLIEQQQAERLDRIEQTQGETLVRIGQEQGERLDRLAELFESANRENLRLFFDGREERREMDERYAQLAGEMEKLRQRITELESRLAEARAAAGKTAAESREAVEKRLEDTQSAVEKQLSENRSAMTEGHKRLESSVDQVRKLSEEGCRSVSEGVWADIFNQTIAGSAWLRDKTFSPGRWAVGYPYLYVMYRVLNETKPKRILELGLGQSTRMIAQYAAAHQGVEHFVVEHDPEWIAFFTNDFQLPAATKIVQLPWDFVPYKEAESVRVYKDFTETFAGQRFDFISVDGPLGGDMKKYSRIDVLRSMPDILSESFTVMVDDYNRDTERRTVREMESLLEENGIPCEKGFYSGSKELMLLTSPDHSFLATM